MSVNVTDDVQELKQRIRVLESTAAAHEATAIALSGQLMASKSRVETLERELAEAREPAPVLPWDQRETFLLGALERVNVWQKRSFAEVWTVLPRLSPRQQRQTRAQAEERLADAEACVARFVEAQEDDAQRAREGMSTALLEAVDRLVEWQRLILDRFTRHTVYDPNDYRQQSRDDADQAVRREAKNIEMLLAGRRRQRLDAAGAKSLRSGYSK